METKIVIEQSTEISRNLDNIATELFNTSKVLYSKGEINYKQYNEIYNNYYQPIISLSSKVVMDDSIQLMEGLDVHLKEIKKGTDQIQTTIKRIKKAEDIYTAFAHLIAAAASVATFIASPNPASLLASSSTIATMIEKLKSVDIGKGKEKSTT